MQTLVVACALVGPREFGALHALHTARMMFVIGPASLVAFGADVLDRYIFALR